MGKGSRQGAVGEAARPGPESRNTAHRGSLGLYAIALRAYWDLTLTTQ